MNRILKNSVFIFVILLVNCSKQNLPQACVPVPTPQQLEWQQMEYYMFIHFGPNTFTNVEWGSGEENPQVFNPTALDCRQWAATARDAGMKGIIITAKHHDGFCLWPSAYSTHTVRESPWKDGKGDVLKELSEACREYGLKFGVYLSPWDRNHPTYGTPEYNQTFANMLKEVLGNYGPVFEQWFDGACGEGPNGKRQVYDWPLFNETVRSLQPNAVIFSDVGPDCRWIGNEAGRVGETNWSKLNTAGFAPGLDAPKPEVLNQGEENGTNWVPGEADVTIRPGWFYSPDTDDKVKSVKQLFDIYCTSVGRNANLLLNVPPDRRGRIHPNDSLRLMEFRKLLDETFADDLAKSAKINANKTSTVLKWKEPQTFNLLVLQEDIALGQRVKSFRVEYWDGQNWALVDRQTTIGYKRILQFPAVTTRQLRITVDEFLTVPALKDMNNKRPHQSEAFCPVPRDCIFIFTVSINKPVPRRNQR